MTTLAPERTLDQRMRALQHANEIRIGRSVLKRKIRAGATDVAAVLSDPPVCVRSMKVFDLLCVIPKFGPVRATRLMRALSVSPSKTVAGMSGRQREAVIRELEAR